MLKNSSVAHSEIESVRKNLAEFAEFRQREWNENRRAQDSFFTNLAFFAGGTIALSVTYHGYLQTKNSSIVDIWFLAAAWVSLLITSITALFSSYVYAIYLFFARQSEAVDFEIKRCETEIQGLPNIPHLRLTTGQPLDGYIEMLAGDIPKLKEAKATSERKKNRWWSFRKWFARIAQASFVIGLILLLAFAIANLKLH